MTPMNNPEMGFTDPDAYTYEPRRLDCECADCAATWHTWVGYATNHCPKCGSLNIIAMREGGTP